MKDDVTAKDSTGWRIDARLTERIREIAKREGRKVQEQAERVVRAGLIALGEIDPIGESTR